MAGIGEFVIGESAIGIGPPTGGVDEAANAKTQLGGGLAQGVDTLSDSQEIEFVQYVRVVLPFDGFVFWARADKLRNGALYGAYRYNSVPFNAGQSIALPAKTIKVAGSLHYATDVRQDATTTQAVNGVVFTALTPVNDLNAVGPGLLYIGEWQGQRFAFSSRAKFYKQADLYHYRGDAIYPAMQSQIIDHPGQFDYIEPVVSNSLPIWLSLQKYGPVFPSYLVPDNIQPPYIAIDIDPETTEALGQAPVFTPNDSQFQLVKERVKITTYGMRNLTVMDYLRYLMHDSLKRDDVWGIMNMPVPRDEKVTQRELGIIAMKKNFVLEVNYYQQRLRDIARQLILQVFVTYVPTDVIPT